MVDAPSPTSDDSSDDSSDAERVELLVSGRERRKTAGNRYNRDMVLQEVGNEDDPDEVALLFAEGQEGEDEEFRSDADEEDVMSSSDDDDQGPNVAGEELEGEKEIDRQKKMERAKKRKADMALTQKSAIRKRARIDPTATRQPLPKKPSKKQERVTWLPDQDTAGARASSRQATVAHREQTLVRLKESEAQSKKLKAMKAKRDKERARDAPKALTQADRLAEAGRIERRNAKSLNRWEATEKKRAEEQAAKLAALKNRKLEGAVLTWWSGKAKWRGPRILEVGHQALIPIIDPSEPKKRGRKTNAYHAQMAALRTGGESVVVRSTSPTQQSRSSQYASHEQQPALQSQTPQPSQPSHMTPPPTGSGPAVPPGSGPSFLSGIHDFANMQAENTGTTDTGPTSPGSTTAPVSEQSQDQEMADESSTATSPAPFLSATSHAHTYPPRLNFDPLRPDTPTLHRPPAPSPLSVISYPATLPIPGQPEPPAPYQQPPTDHLPQPPLSVSYPYVSQPSTLQPSQSPPPPPPLPAPVEEGYTTKNMLILNDFEDLPSSTQDSYSFLSAPKRQAKLVQHRPELCPITMQLARYRDPVTGIGYANMQAYKVLKELKDHKYAWSAMLGCYVGKDGAAVARGVPEGWPG